MTSTVHSAGLDLLGPEGVANLAAQRIGEQLSNVIEGPL